MAFHLLTVSHHSRTAIDAINVLSLRLRVQRSRLAMMIGEYLADKKFDAWRAVNSDKPFSDYYVHQVRSRTGRNIAHPTLGARGFDAASGQKVRWNSTSFAERGQTDWQMYVDEAALKHDMKLVDFGCGALRIGQHAIGYLDRGNYWGLDVTDDFFSEGLVIFGPDKVAAKEPKLSVIGERSIAEVASWQPDVVISNAVLQHVPVDELSIFFGRIAAMLSKPGAIAMIQFLSTPVVRRVKAMSWGYPDDYLASVLKTIDPALTIRFRDWPDNRRSLRRSPRRMMIIAR